MFGNSTNKQYLKTAFRNNIYNFLEINLERCRLMFITLIINF